MLRPGPRATGNGRAPVLAGGQPAMAEPRAESDPLTHPAIPGELRLPVWFGVLALDEARKWGGGRGCRGPLRLLRGLEEPLAAAAAVAALPVRLGSERCVASESRLRASTLRNKLAALPGSCGLAASRLPPVPSL